MQCFPEDSFHFFVWRAIDSREHLGQIGRIRENKEINEILVLRGWFNIHPRFPIKTKTASRTYRRDKNTRVKPSEVVTSVMISTEDFVSIRKIQSKLFILTRALRERIAVGRAKP